MNDGLSDALDRVARLWQEASEVWGDTQRVRFEADHLRPILEGGSRYLDALTALSHAFRESEVNR